MLVDTNILVRTLQPHHPLCSAAERAIRLLAGQGKKLHVVAQNLIELWVVATRPPGENGLGMSTVEAAAELIAAMKVHGLTAILTFDRAGFSRFSGVEVMHPAEVHPIEAR